MDLLAALQDAEVEYVVMGAHALAAHGVVRASGDLDVFVRPSDANAARVIQALQAFGAPLEKWSSRLFAMWWSLHATERR